MKSHLSMVTPGQVLKITCDSSANKKILRVLEKKGMIEIVDVNIENFSKKNVIEAVGVWGHSKWNDGSVWSDGSKNFSIAKSIIGGDNIGDVRHLEAHLRNANDIFVTEDLAQFVHRGRRECLEEIFPGLRIMTSEELKIFCNEIEKN